MRLPQVSFSMAILEAVTSVRGWHGELGVARFQTLVIGLHVVAEEQGCADTLGRIITLLCAVAGRAAFLLVNLEAEEASVRLALVVTWIAELER